MDKLFENIGASVVFIVAIICYTVYEICALQRRPTKAERFEELRQLNELREKGVITQKEFDEKKAELLG